MKTILKYKLVLIILFLLPLYLSCEANKKNDQISQEEIEELGFKDERMKAEDDGNPAWEKLDEALRTSLTEEYNSTKEKRGFFEKYYDDLGVDVLTGLIENRFPFCHSQGHDLGKVVFSKALDFDKALKDCGDSCTNGCMHGVISEAFGDDRYKDILKSVNSLCGDLTANFSSKNYDDVALGMSQFCDTGEMSNLHKRGNCAHAMGHAIMVLSENDLDASMETCASFEEEGMGYYCATGAFMEYVDGLLKSRKLKIDDKSKTDHYPCDVNDEYPAACYRYMSRVVGYRKGIKDPAELIQECKELEPRLRRGCFHGVGASISRKVEKNPYLVNQICLEGNEDDAVMCIEGVIEKLADFNEDIALKVCNNLIGKNKKVCLDAANEKMYRPDKSSLDLYCK